MDRFKVREVQCSECQTVQQVAGPLTDLKSHWFPLLGLEAVFVFVVTE